MTKNVDSVDLLTRREIEAAISAGLQGPNRTQPNNEECS